MLTRNIYPHDKLDDAVYSLVVKDLDVEAGTTEGTKTLLTGGVAGLDKASGGNWLEAPRERQGAGLPRIAGGARFLEKGGEEAPRVRQNTSPVSHLRFRGHAWGKRGGRLPHRVQ